MIKSTIAGEALQAALERHRRWVRDHVDYDDRPPSPNDEEDGRPIDVESIDHDRAGREIQRLEQEIRGHAKPAKCRMATAALRPGPRGR